MQDRIGFCVRAGIIAGYKPAITIYREEKRREKKAGYKFVAGCNTDSKMLCVYERCDRILMVKYIFTVNYCMNGLLD
jgi:hypothetical protein